MLHSSSGRLMLVSNRLPVTVSSGELGWQVKASAGGVATALSDLLKRHGGQWIGWAGNIAEDGQTDELDALLAMQGLVPVPLSAHDVVEYYERFANGVIWPLFHYQIDRLPLADAKWDLYRRVNERFADAVCRCYRPGDIIWVHDYHLLLLPQLLRERLPSARIGFFLHIPFPSSELIRILPWRKALLTGMLGADLVGFHTRSYARHFLAALDQVLELDPAADHVAFEGREVRFGAFPIGIDAARFDNLARNEEVQAMAAAIRDDAAGRAILLGVDRLDYTKGIPRRLLAFEHLLATHPELCNKVRLVQVAVPSRGGVESYQTFRRGVEELVGRINGRYGTAGWVPVHYLHRSFSTEELVALYRAADVMLVTPLRDGMNLVAKEFVASRPDEGGVLVLSEFAGAAETLEDALLINPYDIAGTAEVLARALSLDPVERQHRMSRLRAEVATHDVHTWARSFLNGTRAGRQVAGHRGVVAPRSWRAAEEELALVWGGPRRGPR